jgi:hypothetical protein
MKFSGLGRLISTLYNDKLDINRYQKVLQVDSTTKSVLSTIPLYSDVPCRISFSSIDNADNESQSSNIKYQRIVLFCAVSVDIQKGDFVTAYRMQDDGSVLATYTGKCGLPSVYASHKEVELVQKGDA